MNPVPLYENEKYIETICRRICEIKGIDPEERYSDEGSLPSDQTGMVIVFKTSRGWKEFKPVVKDYLIVKHCIEQNPILTNGLGCSVPIIP